MRLVENGKTNSGYTSRAKASTPTSIEINLHIVTMTCQPSMFFAVDYRGLVPIFHNDTLKEVKHD